MSLDATARILVVDDSSFMQRIMHEALKDLGYSQIESAASAPQALARIEKQGFDLVISDYEMRLMNGYDLMRHLRSDRRCRDIPFVLMTTREPEIALTAEARDILKSTVLKPFTPEKLAQAIARACGAVQDARSAATQARTRLTLPAGPEA